MTYRRSSSFIEPLESRKLFSAILPPLSLPSVETALAVTASDASGGTVTTGVSLNLVAGQAFNGSVGFISNSMIATSTPSVSIDWGDGSTSTGTLQADTVNGVSGYDIIGSHTYASAGTDQIVSTVTLIGNSGGGGVAPLFALNLPTVISTAVVAPASVGSPAPTPIAAVAGQSLSATLGQVTALVPAKGLRAKIKWGDGGSSSGKLSSTGTLGIDTIDLNVSGKHRFRKPGTYTATATVTKPNPTRGGKTIVVGTVTLQIVVAPK